MKFLHLADLHLGKSLHGVSLLSNGDQPYWVTRFLELAEEKQPDAVLIAGDVYDRGMPSGAAMQLLSRLAGGLSELAIPLLITAGNHDSGERLSCFRDILSRQNVHIAGLPQKEMVHVVLQDEFGPVTFWLMPYVFPLAVAKALEDDSIRDYDTAVRRLIGAQPVDFSARNVIVAHQNVTKGGKDGLRGGSESVVGGIGQVDYTAFDGFEYAALGHIHASYAVGREAVRYAGSPLCYHFDEIRQPKKGAVLVTLGSKGTPACIETLTVPPLHPMREIRGSYRQLLDELTNAGEGEYWKCVLTDQPLTPAISAQLQSLAESRGSVLMERVSTFQRFRSISGVTGSGNAKDRPVEDLFADFYTERSGGEDPEEAELALMRFAAELLRSSDAGADGKSVDPALAEQLLDQLLKEAD